MGDTRKMTAQPDQDMNAILACKLRVYKLRKLSFFARALFFPSKRFAN